MFSSVLNIASQVPAQRAREEQRLLRDDGDVAAQLVQAEVLGEAAADEDRPLGLGQAKERRHEGRLSGPGPSHHADLKKCDAKVSGQLESSSEESKILMMPFSRL